MCSDVKSFINPITVNIRFNRFVIETGKSLFKGSWLSMIALCRNKSIQIHLQENTSKLMKFIKSPQEMVLEVVKNPEQKYNYQIMKISLDRKI